VLRDFMQTVRSLPHPRDDSSGRGSDLRVR